MANNVVHYVFLNDDGSLLAKLTSIPNDPISFVRLTQSHFDFITERYKNAEIRGYIDNSGNQKYIIYHEGSLKYIFFGGVIVTQYGFWKEIWYELSKNIEVSDNIIQR